MANTIEDPETAANNVHEYVRQAMRIKDTLPETDKAPSVESIVISLTIEVGVKRLLEALEKNRKFQ